jgi:hypothetical protein
VVSTRGMFLWHFFYDVLFWKTTVGRKEGRKEKKEKGTREGGRKAIH